MSFTTASIVKISRREMEKICKQTMQGGPKDLESVKSEASLKWACTYVKLHKLCNLTKTLFPIFFHIYKIIDFKRNYLKCLFIKWSNYILLRAKVWDDVGLVSNDKKEQCETSVIKITTRRVALKPQELFFYFKFRVLLLLCLKIELEFAKRGLKWD